MYKEILLLLKKKKEKEKERSLAEQVEIFKILNEIITAFNDGFVNEARSSMYNYVVVGYSWGMRCDGAFPWLRQFI